MENIIEEQFLLAKNGISLTESNKLADFEREAYVDLAIKYLKSQSETLSHLVDS